MKKIEDIIKKYLEGRASDEEQFRILGFLRESKENQFYFNQYKRDWENLQEKSFTLKEWQAWINVKEKITNKDLFSSQANKWLGFYRAASAIGAILLLVLLVGIPMLEKQRVVVATKPGQTIEIILPDSSSAILNSSSSLSYHPLAFMLKRKVEMEGEAYFNVVNSRNKSFKVESDDLNIKVTGTRFNVNAYPGRQNAAVVLEEGKVEVSLKTEGEEMEELEPGEIFCFNKENNTVEVENVNTKLYTSWTDGILYFYDSLISDVIPRIERRYGVKIRLLDSQIDDFIFSTTLRDEPLDQVLDLFKQVLPVQINEVEGEIHISLDQKRYERFMNK